MWISIPGTSLLSNPSWASDFENTESPVLFSVIVSSSTKIDLDYIQYFVVSGHTFSNDSHLIQVIRNVIAYMIM